MEIISTLKNLCSLNFLLKLKYLPSIAKQKKIDAPDYPNIGDQAIALSIRKFAYKYFSQYEFIEIMQKDIFKYIKSLKKQINNDDMIFLTGGGNMGNIYKIFEATRRFVIKSFPNNKIVIFPQTIEYTDDFFGYCSCKYSQKLYSIHKYLILCAREEFSYKKMKKIYPTTNIVLCPDIVLSLDKHNEKKSEQYVSLCLRDDCEMSLTDKDREYIKQSLENKNLNIRQLSTISDVTNISQENRERLVYEKLLEFSLSKFVITDRLHAMIFCYLTNTPCIVFGNSNHKIKGVYKFISDAPYIEYLDNISDFREALRKFEPLSVEQYENKKLDFADVVNVIREG